MISIPMSDVPAAKHSAGLSSPSSPEDTDQSESLSKVASCPTDSLYTADLSSTDAPLPDIPQTPTAPVVSPGPTLGSMLLERHSCASSHVSSSSSSTCSVEVDRASRRSMQSSRSMDAKRRIQAQYEHALLPQTIDTISDYTFVENFCGETRSSSEGKFTCSDCEMIFHYEEDCYNHAYPSGTVIGGHTWILVDPKRARRGLHVIRWAGKGNDSYILKGEHAVTVGQGDVVYMSNEGVVMKKTMEDFAGSEPIYLQMYNFQTRLPRSEAAKRAVAAVGKKGYHPVFMNSEHFASWACMNYKRSTELWGVGAMAGTASVSTQAAVFLLAGPAAFLAAHGALSIAKAATATLLAKDSATRAWDDVKATFGDVRCCVCNESGQLVERQSETPDEGVVSTFSTSFQGMFSTFTDALNSTSEEEPTTNSQTSIIFETDLYPVCGANHAACANCLPTGTRPFLCLREDCYELYDDSKWGGETYSEISTRMTNASTVS